MGGYGEAGGADFAEFDVVEFQAPQDESDLVEFLTASAWPFHVLTRPSPADVRRWMDGWMSDTGTRVFWLGVQERKVGLIRLHDLEDDTAMFDLRIRQGERGKGYGTQALLWLTEFVFAVYPHVRRVEGETRQDNAAMRRTFRKCNYVKEAHYRAAWPKADGTYADSISYAMLRSDWARGTVTPVQWDDEVCQKPFDGTGRLSELLSDFRSFFTQYQTAWNDCDAERVSAFCSPELRARWAYPGNQISDWGYDEAYSGWREAFQSYAGRSPKWHFHEVVVAPVDEDEVLAVYWVTFELDGKPTKEVNLFVETFRRESAGWQLIRSYVESSLSKQHVELHCDL